MSELSNISSNEEEEPIDLSRAPRLQEILNASREDYNRRGGIPAAEVRRRLEELERAEAASPAQ